MNSKIVKSVSVGTIVLLLSAGQVFADEMKKDVENENHNSLQSDKGFEKPEKGREMARRPESSRRELNRPEINGEKRPETRGKMAFEDSKKNGAKAERPSFRPEERKSRPEPTGNGRVIGTANRRERPAVSPVRGVHVEKSAPERKPMMPGRERFPEGPKPDHEREISLSRGNGYSNGELLAVGAGGLMVGSFITALISAAAR